MTVKELIEELAKLDPDTLLFLYDSSYYTEPVTYVGPRERDLRVYIQ